MTTITYFAADLTAAETWYAELLGVRPYFRKELGGAPAYVEFRIGDYQHELGLLDRRYAAPASGGTGGPVTYWAVDDVHQAYERLLALGATANEPPREQGPGFVTASVVDPFDNVLGVMVNEHYLDVLAGSTHDVGA